MSKVVLWTIVVALLLLILGICGGLPAPVVFLLYLAFGWVAYLGRVVSQAHVSWPGVITAALCMLGVITIGHRLGRWLLGEMTGRVWTLRWTLSITAIIVLMFVAGIGAVGVTHQAAWLARSDRRMFTYGGRPLAQRVKCASNLRQIGQALTIYANANGGQFPESLSQLYLQLHEDITPEVFVCPASMSERSEAPTTQERAGHLGDFRHCSYGYYGRGLKLPLPVDRPLAAEPLFDHDDEGMNILFGDGHVEWLTPAAAQAVMEKW